MAMYGMARRPGTARRVLAWVAAACLAASAGPAAAASCDGDCDGNGVVTIDELVTLVNISLELQLVERCSAGDGNGDGQISIEEILRAVIAAFEGCPGGPMPTATPTGSMTASTPTPTIGPCGAGACAAGPAGFYCCTRVTPPPFFQTLANCDGSGIYPNGCWVQTPGATPYCATEDVCQVPASTPTATATPPATATTTPSAPTATATPTPTIGSCTAADADGQCNQPGREGEYCCAKITPPPFFTDLQDCDGSGDSPNGCWVQTPGQTPYCDTASVCQVPTSTATPTATATGTATSTGTPTGTATATATGPTPTATPRCSKDTPTPAPTSATCRMIEVANDAEETVWISAVGGSVEPTCFDGAATCLVIPAAADSASLACACATDAPLNGTLRCPEQSTPDLQMDAWVCTCTSDADCGESASCGAIGRCFWNVPPPVTHGASDNLWELASGETASFCLPPPAEIDGVASPVWWGGGVFGRTGCLADGTRCATADCDSCPDAACPAGVGGAVPYSQAEFTLASDGIDYYDVTIINGANLAIEMAPLPSPTAPPAVVGTGTPSPTPDPYWCGAPGRGPSPTATMPSGALEQGTADPPPLDPCSWIFDVQSIPITPTPGQALLLHSYYPCDSSKQPDGCPTMPPTATATESPTPGTPTPGTPTPTASPSPNPTYGFWTCTDKTGQCIIRCQSDADCAGTHLPHCNLDSNYCECHSDSECPTGQYCGTQFLDGESFGYARLCGAFAGWWTADDICGNAALLGANATYGALECTDALVDLLGCTGTNNASCYNTTAGNTDCCGCGTWIENDMPLYPDWPAQATLSCDANNPSWGATAQPWIGYLKQACPTAYTYPYDDSTSTFTCMGSGDDLNLLGYRITFRSLPTPPLDATPTPTPSP